MPEPLGDTRFLFIPSISRDEVNPHRSFESQYTGEICFEIRHTIEMGTGTFIMRLLLLTFHVTGWQ
jgi:hypothetical protein